MVIGNIGNGGAGLWEQVYASTPSATNALIYTSGAGHVVFQSPAAGDLLLNIVGTMKGRLFATDGKGFAITAGTATTDVNALSVTQTWNAAGVAFVAKDLNVTNTASAAGALLERWRVGGTAVAHITKAGVMDATGYSVAGAAGANFGPGLPTSITVVGGIVTAIS